MNPRTEERGNPDSVPSCWSVCSRLSDSVYQRCDSRFGDSRFDDEGFDDEGFDDKGFDG